MLKKNIQFVLLVIGLFFTLTVPVLAQPIDALFHQSSDPTLGKKNAPVTVVEFFDYRCGHCKSMANVISSISQSNPNVRFVFKEYPIFGDVSEFAARAALAANKQGKYYPFSHALLTSGPLSEESILRIARAQKLNMAKFEKDMNSNAIRKEINANILLAQEVGARGTPAFFIGPTNTKDAAKIEFVLGEMSQSELEAAINKSMS